MFTELNAIPTFEVLTIISAVAFIFSLAAIAINKKWHVLKQPWYIWAIVAAGIYGNNICYVIALKYAPPAQAILIYYTWPIFAVILGSLVNRKKNTSYTYLALALGLLAISLAHMRHHAFVFEPRFIIGYISAFLVALIWSSYTVISQKIQNIPLEVVGIIFGFGMLCSMSVHHAMHESMVIPDLKQAVFLCTIGLFSFGIAYQAWQVGISHGNLNLLRILSYSSPTLAIIWLILFGFTTFSINLIIACALVVLSSAITGWQEKKIESAVAVADAPKTPE